MKILKYDREHELKMDKAYLRECISELATATHTCGATAMLYECCLLLPMAKFTPK